MPIIILRDKKATKDQVKKVSYPYGSYIKVVIDIKKEILAGGAEMYYDEEKSLLEYGSLQKNLWGGGIDLLTGEVTYDSMINVRPNQNNLKRDIESKDSKEKFKEIVLKLIPYEEY